MRACSILAPLTPLLLIRKLIQQPLCLIQRLLFPRKILIVIFAVNFLLAARRARIRLFFVQCVQQPLGLGSVPILGRGRFILFLLRIVI